MKIDIHEINHIRIAELISDNNIITNIDDGTDLAGNLYYQNFDGVIIYKKNIAPIFFDLKSGIAGEILQKFSNFRLRLVIVGDFSSHPSKSLNDFIYESNKRKQVNFTISQEEAIQVLSEK